MDRKRILLITLFILSVILFGWGLYAIFFSSLLPGAPTNGNTNQVGTLPTPGNGGPGRVNTNASQTPVLPGFSTTIDVNAPTDIAQGGYTKVVDYGSTQVQDFVSGSQGAFFYNKDSGLFYKMDAGKAVPISDQKFFDVSTITWSADQSKAILEYPDGSNIVYDFKANKQISLPKELTDFSFSPQGDSIAGKWMGKTNDENWLMVGDSNGSNFKLIEPLGDRYNNVQVDYSNDGQVVALVRDPVDANTQSVLPIGLNGENFPSFNVEGLKFESKWAPSGDQLLYNVSTKDNNYDPKLLITGGNGDTLGSSSLDLQLNTWASKCAFNAASTSLYCAEPTSLPRGSGLYPDLARGIPDVFYRIDLRSGQKIPLAVPVGNQSSYSASSVFLSQDEKSLYFVDELTNQLHSIRLQ